MADYKIKRTQTGFGNTTETSFKATGVDYLNDELVKSLFGGAKAQQIITEGKPEKETVLAEIPSSRPDVKHEVVAIYDNAGIPSIMHRFTRVTNEELFGGSSKTHGAFIIGGEEYDEIYISVYENCEINGKPYSLPHMKPWTNITNDDAARACFSKGEGWHLLTALEWGLLADTSLKNGTLPHGNTNCGKYHAEPEEQGEAYDGYRTLTGSGPATWTHDHTPEGVHDLCGNIWEMVRGLRLKNGKLQAAKNNDAALDIDLTEEGDDWQDVLDDAGNPVRVSVSDEDDITITTEQDIEKDYCGSRWGDVKIECESEQLKELALFNGESEAYFYADSTEGEYFPLRGGHWFHGASAGVFYTHLCNPRSNVGSHIGFRSAYFKKN